MGGRVFCALDHVVTGASVSGTCEGIELGSLGLLCSSYIRLGVASVKLLRVRRIRAVLGGFPRADRQDVLNRYEESTFVRRRRVR